MKQVYDWDTNVIYYEDKKGKVINFKLHGDKNIVKGNSATGKTYLCSLVTKIRSDSNANPTYKADNITVLNPDNKPFLTQISNKLILIDRAELLLNAKDVDIINNDDTNRYLIFSRKPLGIAVTPNHCAEIIDTDNNTKELYYKYNVKGWC